MKLAILFGGICLSFRKTMDFAAIRQDPRGLTGSEFGAIRIAEECAKLGHETTLFTESSDTEWNGVKISKLSDGVPAGFDAVIAVNEPDLLRAVAPGPFRLCAYWLNGTTHCQVGFDSFVDLYASPSSAHMHRMFTDPEWHRVAPIPSAPDGQETYVPREDKWIAVRLGCDPERYAADTPKISGRCIYSSSPDRGLHWLLQEWPAIKRAVPHATLHIFYRLEPWIRGFDTTPYFPPIEPNRARALYVQEALARLSDPKWGITLRDSVSRETIEQEMAQAEVMAYPCDTLSWSEGFSCSLLEGCAARACPVTTDCDALGDVYGEALPLVRRNDRDTAEWVREWRQTVITALQVQALRDGINEKARAFAERHTWRLVAETYIAEIEKRRHGEEKAA